MTDRLDLLRAVDQHRVSLRSRFSNSGAGSMQWLIDHRVAGAVAADLLTDLYRTGLLMETEDGLTLSARGRARLTLS